MKKPNVSLLILAAGLLLTQQTSARAPDNSDIVLESLSGFGTGAICAYGLGLVGSQLHEGSRPLDMSGFVGGAIVGYSLGTPLGIWSYSKLRGIDRNAAAAGLASFVSGMAAWYLIAKTYESNQQLGPTVLILLPNVAGLLGNNIGVLAGPRQASLTMRF